jgi:hypothetical protein
MNPELIVAAMLNTQGISALVGTRRAMTQLPQNTAFPALVYTVIDDIPLPNLRFNVVPQRAQARVQINPLAKTIAEVKAIHEQVRLAMDFKLQQTFAGKTVITSRLDIFGTPEKDLDTGIWTQSADYLMSYYE